MDGFEFQQWQWDVADDREPGSAWFTDTWLARLDTFSSGPYNQVAVVMDAAGHPTIASDIRYSRSHAERLQVPLTRPDRWGRQLHWLVLGYGFRPWWALLWAVAVWSIGFVVLRGRLEPGSYHRLDFDDIVMTRAGSRSGRWLDPIRKMGGIRPVTASPWSAGQAAVYSLDRLLPGINLVDPDDDFPPLSRAQETWLTIQQVLGWLLTLFIVGWLSGLLVQA